MSLLRSAARHVAGRLLKRALSRRYRNFRPGSEPTQWVRVRGLRLLVRRTVFNPRIHFTSAFFAGYLRRPGVVPRAGSVLDTGTGSGLLSIAVAQSGASRVVATDINPEAVRSASANVKRCGYERVVEVREGDLFSPVAGERFDLVVCNPPYLRGTAANMAEQAYLGGPNYEWLARFSAGAARHLTPRGRVLVVVGTEGGLAEIVEQLAKPGWTVREVARRDIWLEVLYILEMVR